MRQVSDLPPYNMVAEPGSKITLPIDLQGARLFYLPLPARLERLQSLVNQYLNNSARPCGLQWFSAAAPYVFLTLAHYGSLSSDAVNQGWVAYDEILFAIPISWYHRRHLREPFSFKAWATFAPIIFVSNQAAQWAGRELLGWVKTLARIETSPHAWTDIANDTFPVLSVDTFGFQQPFSGEMESRQRVLTITRTRDAVLDRYPMDLGQLANPLATTLNAMARGWQLLGNTFFTTFGSPIAGRPPGLPNPANPVSYLRMLDPLTWSQTWDPVRFRNTAQLGYQVLSALPWLSYVNTVNLKQFPSADNPDRACYSAITNAPLEFVNIQAMGLLGATAIAQGRASGGYQVQIPYASGLPIVHMLGLEPVETIRDIANQNIDIVQPLFPNWVQGDLRIAYAENYAVSEHAAYRNTLPQSRPGGVPPYNTGYSPVRVLPICAHPEKLEKFVNAYLNNPCNVCGVVTGLCRCMRQGIQKALQELNFLSEDELASIADPEVANRLQVVGNHVYVVITNYKDLISVTRPAGLVDVREILFMVPVQVTGIEKTLWVTPYSFTDNDAWAISMRESSGLDGHIAAINSTKNGWFNRSASTPEPVLKVWTDIVPALGVGQKSQLSVVAEVVVGDVKPPQHLYVPPRLQVSVLPSGPRGIYAQSSPTLALLTLKQFRDAEFPNKACYQKLVVTPISRHELESTNLEKVFLLLPFYSVLPIAEVLGLEPTWIEERDGRPVYVFETVQPFAFDSLFKFGLSMVVPC
jgi:hypothetical protein